MFRDKVQFLTLAAAAHKIDLPKKALEKLVQRGVIPALVWCDEDGKRHYRFDPEDIRDLMTQPKAEITYHRRYKAGGLGYARQLNLV